MSLSSIALEQREKEAEALRYFLIYSLIASLALHIGLLAFVLNNLLSRVPKEDEPIEVVMIAPTVEATKPPEEKKSQPKVNSGGGGGKPAQTQTAASDKTPSFVPIARQPTAETAPQFLRLEKPEQLTPLPIPKFVDPVKTQPQERSQPTEPLKPVKKITPEMAQPFAPPVQETPIAKQPTPQTPTKTQKVIDTLKNAPRQRSLQNTTPEVAQPSTRPLSSAPPASIAGNPYATQQSQTSNQPSGSETNIRGNGLGNRDVNDIGNGTGNGISNGIGNGIGNKPKEGSTLATAPKPRTVNGSSLDRADCLKCNIKYPDSARSRGIEGNPEVAINYDQNGEVTNVRLIRPSGSRELDEALVEQARDFKLKRSASGKQGVRVSANFVIRGTQRHSELQKRQREKEAAQRERQRQAEQKERETEAAASTPTPTRESPTRSQEPTTGVVTDTPTPTRRKRDVPSLQQAPPLPGESEIPSQSLSGRSEPTQTQLRKLGDIPNPPQKPSQSPPSDAQPGDSNTNSTNGN